MALFSGRDTHSRRADRDCAVSTFIGTPANASKDQTTCPKAGDYVYLSTTHVSYPWLYHRKAITNLSLMQCMQLVQGSDNFLHFALHGKEVPNWKYNPSNRMLYARVEQKKCDRYWERYHPLEFDMFVM